MNNFSNRKKVPQGKRGNSFIVNRYEHTPIKTQEIKSLFKIRVPTETTDPLKIISKRYTSLLPYTGSQVFSLKDIGTMTGMVGFELERWIVDKIRG